MRTKNEPVLLLFAKKPELGKVKTRLCPPLTSVQAKQVAILLIEKSVERFSEFWPGELELCVWPDRFDTTFEALSTDFDVKLSTQTDGDLGQKMHAAISRKVSKGQNAMVIGTDIPHCHAQILESAYKALSNDKNVIGPTFDGGYYCVGVNNPNAAMFENVSWGSEQAYAQTLTSCAQADINFDVVLPFINDLDSYEDLLDISKLLPELRAFVNNKD